MSWVKRLTREYAAGRKALQASRDRLTGELTDAQRQDLQQINSMIAEMAFAINWMATGRQPGLYRGVDRRGAYERPYVLDKDLFPSLQEPEPVRTLRLTDEQRRAAIAAIRSLSDRERDCYLLHMAHGLSERKIAENLRLSRRTVRTNIDRAKKKILESQAGQAI